MRAVLVGALLSAAIAGCLQGDMESGTDGSSEGPVTYSFDCLDGMDGEPCSHRFESSRFFYTEPYAFSDPSNPLTWGIGAMAADNPAYAADDQEHPGWAAARLHFWFTEDGGESWRLSIPPPMFDDQTYPSLNWAVADPAALIDDQQVVHVTAIYETFDDSDMKESDYSIMYVNSTDHGRSWGEPQTLSMEGYNDRNWMLFHEGQLHVAWWKGNVLSQNPQYYLDRVNNEPVVREPELQIATSSDRGATWQRQVYPDCWYVGPMAVWDDVPTLTCRHGEPHEPGTLLLKQLDEGFWKTKSSFVADCSGPHIQSSSVGLVMATRGCPAEQGWYAVMAEASNWPIPTPYDELLERPITGVLWQDVDKFDRVHWITETLPDGTELDDSGWNSDRSRIDYVVFDLETQEVMVDVMLREAPDDPDTRPPATTGLGGTQHGVFLTGDHFHGLDWQHGRGLLVWTDRGALQVSWAVGAER